MTERYVPLSKRASAEAERAHLDEALEGVPGHLRESLWAWMRARCLTSSGYLDRDKIRELERVLGKDLKWVAGTITDGENKLRTALYSEQEFFLDAVDYTVTHWTRGAASSVSALNQLLTESGSVWRARQGDGLLRRTSLNTTAAASAAFEHERSGHLLNIAWAAAFGRSPNPSEAYRSAVRAVEAAAQDVVLPSNNRATLGTIIAALRDGAKNFSVTLDSSTSVDGVHVVMAMLQLLWTNQYDRHVSQGSGLHVTQQEAEAAVLLALSVVEWFENGHVQRVAASA